MTFDELRSDKLFHEWSHYEPYEIQYLKYATKSPSVIAAGHKVYDVYSVFSKAKASFLLSSKDFGDIADRDESNRLYVRTYFLTNALIEYAICMDLSWQVVWAITQPESLTYLLNRKYTEMESECTYSRVIDRLTNIIDQNNTFADKAQKLLDSVREFKNDENTDRLRKIYNGYKHRGTIHYTGLGINAEELPLSYNDKCIPILHRDSYSPEEIESVLLIYHEKFEIYMNKIIEILIPDDYLNGIDLGTAISSLIAIDEVLQ